MKPQDILIVLKLLVAGWPGSYAALGQQLGMSASMAHAAVSRARQAGLLHPVEFVPHKLALAEFLVHGLKYVFPGQLGGLTRGLPTSHAAAPLNKLLGAAGQAELSVWPDPAGTRRSVALKPLYRSAPQAARADAKLYQWLALVDAVRTGRARERELACKIIGEKLGYVALRQSR